jgi:hypothetical protein
LEVFTAVTLKNAVFWDVMRRGSRKNRRFTSVLWLLVSADVPGSPILVTLMMETIHSSKMLVLTKAHGISSQKTTFFIENDVFFADRSEVV